MEEDIKKYIGKCNTAALFSPLGWDTERYYSILVLFHEKMATNALEKGEFEGLKGFVIFHEPFWHMLLLFISECDLHWPELNLFERIIFVIKVWIS